MTPTAAEQTALEVRSIEPNTQALELTEAAFNMLHKQAEIVLKGKLAPSSVTSVEQVMVIMLKGRELGVPPMAALNQIHVINNKPTLGAELMLSLIRRRYPHAPIEIRKRDAGGAEVWAGRPGQTNLTKYAFGPEDARRAGLEKKDNYVKHPTDMYFWRCITSMARTLYPECLMGPYFGGEDVVVCDDDGNVVEVEQIPPKSQPQGEAARGVPFDGSAQHVAELGKRLASMKVAEELWSDIAQRMVGKRRDELQGVIDQLLRERGA